MLTSSIYIFPLLEFSKAERPNVQLGIPRNKCLSRQRKEHHRHHDENRDQHKYERYKCDRDSILPSRGYGECGRDYVRCRQFFRTDEGLEVIFRSHIIIKRIWIPWEVDKPMSSHRMELY